MIEWQCVDTVMLDMDGTLLDLNFDNTFWQQTVPQCYADKHQMSLEEARRELMVYYDEHKGTLQWYCLDYWQERLDIDLMSLKNKMSHLIQILPHAIDFIDQLRRVNKRVLLVTNAHRDNLTLKMEVTALQHHFDEIVCSHDYGYCKEDQRFWQAFQQQHGFNAASSLMVDDNLDVLACAKKYGISQVLAIRKPDSTRPENVIAAFPSVSDFSEVIPNIC